MKCSELTVDGTACGGSAMNGSTRCMAHNGLAGRKTILTDDVADNLVVMLRAGNYIGVALNAVGLNRMTFKRWMDRGKSDAEDDAPFRALRERVEQARAEGEVRNVAQIARAASDTWQAAAWLLERQYPERWGRVSVRMRDNEAEDNIDDTVKEADPFAEVDELAEVRRKRTA